MPNCQKLIQAALIVTQNDSRDILRDAAIAIDNGKIVAIGAADNLVKEWFPQETLGYPHGLVMPGLINAHTHAAMTFLRGVADDLPLLDWLQNTVFPMERDLTARIVQLGSLLGQAEMLATGTTSCIDMYIFAESVLKAAAQSGLRCLTGEAVFEFPSAACASYEDALRATKKLAALYQGHDRLSVAVNPHSVYTTTEKILADCRSLALELDLPVHIHLAETVEETKRTLQRHGRRPVAQAKACGLLDTRIIAAHLVDITPEEISTLAAAGACAVHNPASNMKLASGIAPVPQMLSQKLPVALGTDGPASNNQLNMFADMRLAALLHKANGGDPTAMAAQEVLDLATRGGATALGRKDLGQLAIGFNADLLVLDLGCFNLQPMHNPVSQLVYAASGHECRLTMVAGEILYEDGKFTRFSREELLNEIQELHQFVSKKILN